MLSFGHFGGDSSVRIFSFQGLSIRLILLGILSVLIIPNGLQKLRSESKTEVSRNRVGLCLTVAFFPPPFLYLRYFHPSFSVNWLFT